MPSLGNSASWQAYRDKAPFTRKECEYIDIAYQQMDYWAGIIAHPPEGTKDTSLFWTRKKIHMLDWLLRRVFHEADFDLPDDPAREE